MARAGSPVAAFEAAADAVVGGDVVALEQMLAENAELIRARSTRVHRSTLLHYVSANGVEDFRQKTPANIVEVTKVLLAAGADVDAANDPGRGTTLGLVATSYHPARAGVQIALLETLIEAGAAVDGLPGGWNPLTAALANGRGDAAAYLAQRGARLNLEGAAGVGRLDVVKEFFDAAGALTGKATRDQMMSGFAWACEFGHTQVVEFLLGTGIAVDARLRHHGQTGLHWAAYHAHAGTVKLLLDRHAPVNATDEEFNGTPLGWALHAWGDAPPEAQGAPYYDVVAMLVAAGAAVDPAMLTEQVRADARMMAAL